MWSSSSTKTSRSTTTSAPIRTRRTLPVSRSSSPRTARRRSTGSTRPCSGNNPNSSPPQRLDRSGAVTCSQNHAYSAEQMAYDGGLVDEFSEHTAGGGCTRPGDRHGLLRWQHGHGTLEPGSEFRHQRQLVRDAVRAVDGRCDQPDLRRDPRHAARNSRRCGREQHRDRRSRVRRSTIAPRWGDDVRQEHRRPAEHTRRQLGLVPGRFQADRDASGKAICNSSHRNLANASVATTSLTTSRSSTTPRPPTSTTCRRPRRR